MKHWGITAWLAFWATALPAWAQQYEAPQPQPVGEQSMMWEWLYGMVFLVGCLAVAFKPAKRSNLQ